MRLTLRTLLAYLDDVLEPSQTREIGQKVSESPFASGLISRIRDVMRRRRLTAPEVSGPGAGLDPNTVAEYLDNTLAPDRVADVERVCLESDVHLAEVAACHQVLTLVLGEPVEVSSETRERMYALGPVMQEQKLASEEAAAHPPKHGNGRAAAAVTAPSGAFAHTVPDYLKQPAWHRRVLPFAVIALLLAAWLGVLAYNHGLWPGGDGDGVGRQVAVTDLPAKRDGGRDNEEPAGPEQSEQVAAVDASRDTTADEEMQLAEADPALAEDPGLDPPPPPDEPDDRRPVVEPKPPVAVVLPDEGARPPGREGAGEPIEVPIEKPAAEPQIAAEPMPPVRYTSVEGILLHLDEADDQWFVLPYRSAVEGGERLASPEPYEATLDIGQGRVRATLLAGTALQLIGPGAAGPFGFIIEQGRLVLEAGSAAAQDDRIAAAIGIPGELWRIELLTPDTVCGIEVRPRVSSGFEQKLDGPAFTGTLYVVSGSVRFADGGGEVQLIGSGGSIALPAAEEDGVAPEALAGVPSLPAWLSPDERAMTPTTRRYASLFEKEFTLDQPVALTIAPLIKDPRPRVAELAVKALGLTDRASSLVQALAQSPHEEARLAAFEGLREWLPRSPEHQDLVREELDRFFPADEADALYRLLWGYSLEDARDRVTSRQLVEWMGHNRVAIRELAFYHVSRLTGKRYDYRPLNPPAQLQAALARWQSHLEREGALVGEAE